LSSINFIEGKIKEGIEVKERRGRRRRKLLEDLKEMTGYSHLKEEVRIALCGELDLEESLDRPDRLLMNECNP
jgi:hypothetical protein